MLTQPRPVETLNPLQTLLDRIFQVRDELAVVRDLAREDKQRFICDWLGRRLGGHAADLQQIVVAGGADPRDPDPGTFEVMDGTTEQTRDPAELWRWAGDCEQVLVEEYDQVISRLSDVEIVSLLERQRDELRFVDCVLELLRSAHDLSD